MKAEDFDTAHKNAGDTAPKDKDFVYELLIKAFGSKMVTHSLRGGGKSSRLDATILMYIRSMLNERVWAVGLNAEDREIRTSTSRFNTFVGMCHDKEKKSHKYRLRVGDVTESDDME